MRPEAEIRLGRAGNFLFAQTVISRRPCFAFHTSAHDAAVLGEGVEIPFSLPKTFFSVRSRAVLLLFLELLSLVLYSHSFDIFCRSLRSFTQPILFRTLTHLHRRCFGTFTHTKGFGTHTTYTQNHPSIHQKRGLEPKSPPPPRQPQRNPQTSKENAKMPSLRPSPPTTHRPLVTALLGELVGTFLFLLFAFLGASITASYSSTTPPLLTLFFVALAFALSLTANVWAFFRITGAAFNPAVTIALFVVAPRASRSWVRSGGVIVAQLVGGIAAAGVVAGLVPGEGMPGVDTALGGGASVVQGFFIEVLLTAELVFVILMVGVERHRGRFMAPAAVGTAFFLTQLVGELLPLFFVAVVDVDWTDTVGQASTSRAARSTPRAASGRPSSADGGPGTFGFTLSGPSPEGCWLAGSTRCCSF